MHEFHQQASSDETTANHVLFGLLHLANQLCTSSRQLVKQAYTNGVPSSYISPITRVFKWGFSQFSSVFKGES
jgi:hypothetical protein